MSIVVLDYGSGNVRSAVRAVERVLAGLGRDEPVLLTADPEQVLAASGVLVPGVGAYAACMAGLEAVGARPMLSARVAAGQPVLGICVGMQVLFEQGVEHGVHSVGLGLLPGRVELLAAPVVPHMGWNTVAAPPGSRLFAGIESGTRFYFVHSYAVHPASLAAGAPALAGGQILSAVTTHGESFVSAVESGPLWATQFHPEKSGSAGQAILANWVSSLPVPPVSRGVS